MELLGLLRPLLGHEAQHLRDHVAGALDRHHVADPHVEPLDLVGIVQRGARHHDAADIDRLELGDRRQRAGAADLDVDAVQPRARLLGRELVGDRPARRAADEAQPLLPVDAVDLVDHAVDVVGQRRPLDADLAIEGAHLVGRAAELRQRVGLEAPLLQELQVFAVGLPRARLGLAPGIGEEAQRPRRRDRRIELAQRAGGGVARIDVGLLAGRAPGARSISWNALRSM